MDMLSELNFKAAYLILAYNFLFKPVCKEPGFISLIWLIINLMLTMEIPVYMTINKDKWVKFLFMRSYFEVNLSKFKICKLIFLDKN